MVKPPRPELHHHQWLMGLRGESMKGRKGDRKERERRQGRRGGGGGETGKGEGERREGKGVPQVSWQGVANPMP